MRICAVCLTADRQTQTDRAVRSFLAQTYENKMLLILDSGQTAYVLPALLPGFSRNVYGSRLEPGQPRSIGYLRNFANQAAKEAEAIAHWDSDDWSHPDRLAMQ